MAHDIVISDQPGILSNKLLWLITGAICFLVIGFVLPTPQSLIDLVDKQQIAKKMIDWHIANDISHAAWKAKLVLGMIPMAIIYFATEALPIGLVGILMPVFAYFLNFYP
ncbi:MAG: hypothetical protein OMM_06959 [Candidatus Magnetoglobus multicellularis str. Araruama]|uniref:Uncharacterized protein n=1 Tax=Candidatus Magnetoglobus multicellularis str. Araruama TaxID=890399 RepID=A0A1V1PFF6_9BACT|nr:MAG: hypothetical protein OMM_06959 [Candidatus Magnetoglobus multicellularis str. Araruama]